MFKKFVSLILSVLITITNFLGLEISFLEPKVYQNLSYGTHERHKLDIAIPVNVNEDTALILYIHGGGWIGGDKESYFGDIKSMAKKHNVVCASVNYRYICDDVNLFDILDDLDLAMEFIKSFGLENGININRSILTGHSAGGHLSLFYSYTKAKTSAIPPVAVVSNSGPTELNDDNYFYNKDLGKDSSLGTYSFIAQLIAWATGEPVTYETKSEFAEAMSSVSPITYVDENTVPTILNHGKLDDVVPFSNAVMLHNKLTEAGVDHIFNVYPYSDHGLQHDPEAAERASELFDEFIEKYLK